MTRGPAGKLLLAIAAATALLGCETATESPAPQLRPSLATVPSQDDPTTLDVAIWNIEWFGNTGFGPTNETLQMQNVRDVMAGTNVDVWGISELCDTTLFRQVINGMPGFAVVAANDPRVVSGSTYYNGFSNTEQKVALVYRTSLVTFVSAKVILTANDSDFAGRPPVEYKVQYNGQDLVIIVLHAKSGSDIDSYTRRQNGATALKNYLDTNYPTQRVWLIGDLNDDLDTSITPQKPSSYANFVNDPARYIAPTKELSDAGISSTASYPDIIDHQINTNEAYATYVARSAKVYRVDQYVTGYATNTSDHFPVLARYSIAAAGGTNQPPTANFTYSCTNLACNFTDSSTDADGTIATRNWDFGDATSATAQNPAHTYGTAGTYNVSLTVTDNGGATASITKAVTVSTAPAGTPANVIINEILANEPGSSTASEAVEIVNIGGTAASIGGWTVSDGSAVRHKFATGTTLQPGQSIVVFGGSAGIIAGVNGVAASTGSLNLANGGDSVILKNGTTVIQSFKYSSSLAGQDGVSMNRNPDGSATGAFVLHNTISSLKSSPGKRANGTAW